MWSLGEVCLQALCGDQLRPAALGDDDGGQQEAPGRRGGGGGRRGDGHCSLALPLCRRAAAADPLKAEGPRHRDHGRGGVWGWRPARRRRGGGGPGQGGVVVQQPGDDPRLLAGADLRRRVGLRQVPAVRQGGGGPTLQLSSSFVASIPNISIF